ncbi:MAG: cyclodeaminase/cyclohydrolase family protein [Clostridiales Family XIII bacterium]|nr:cyclodeaminase/cyclohydrolase family protein [Clostridiales Family XIII bacterium]
MKEYINDSVKEFVLQLSGKQPAPGGGGASALAGALGIALGGMVANLTIGKPRYAEAEEELKALKVRAYRVQQDLLALVDADAAAFEPLAGAYRMPAETEAEREEKARVMDACLKRAAEVPLAIMERCGEAIELLAVFAEKGSTLALSDAGCGAALAEAAMRSAWLNVKVNTMTMRDADYAARVNAQGRALLAKYSGTAQETYGQVEAGLER